jgi:ATP-binding cassette subfamily G (WHITE) protein 2 (SNQ2)
LLRPCAPDNAFSNLPRQSTADYLTGCTDANERQFAPGRSVSNVPSTPEALEEAYLKSRFAIDMQDELAKFKVKTETEKMDQEAFRKAVLDDKKRGVSKKSPYTLGYTGQIWSLTKRQFQQRLQDRFQLVTSFTLSTVLALVLGGAYFALPLTAQGAFTRGGVIFAASLTIALDAFGEVSTLLIYHRRSLSAGASFHFKYSAAVSCESKRLTAYTAPPRSPSQICSPICHSQPSACSSTTSVDRL